MHREESCDEWFVWGVVQFPRPANVSSNGWNVGRRGNAYEVSGVLPSPGKEHWRLQQVRKIALFDRNVNFSSELIDWMTLRVSGA